MTKIILDLDMGIDDALALAYTLGSPELDLIGITATYGNVLVQDGARNDLALLELFGRPDIPVFVGESHALAKDGFEVLPISEFIHGSNGIGDVVVPDAAASCQEQSAVDFLIDSVAKYGDDLVIVPTGAMTNIATAMRRSPEFAERAHIVFMGGALAVPGNVNACVEANISQDPEAADIMVWQGHDVTMVGLDVTLQTLLTYEETRKWREFGTPAGQFLADATDYYIKAYEATAPDLGGCGLHDPLAVGVAIDPTLVTLLPVNLKVDVEGPTRGRTIGDETRMGKSTTTRVAVAVDAPRFLTEFMTRVGKIAAGL